MDIVVSNRVNAIGSYAFADVDNIVAQLKKEGVQPIDFGVGDPTLPTPALIRQACKDGIEKRKSSGYPAYFGEPEYRQAVARWSRKRFGLTLDPDTEIISTVGAKEAIFNFPETFINPGDYTIALNPGYPAWSRGTHFAEGNTYFLNLLPGNGFLPDLSSVPKEVLKRARLLWINYPNNPTTAFAPESFYREVLEFGERHGIIVCSDESYTENYYDEPPSSILQLKKEGVIVFQSLSKRSNMTCYRIGWAAGDSRIIAAYKKVKPNVDSGTATFIQDAAIAALEDETHVEELRKDYRSKRDLIVDAFSSIGLARCVPGGTIYIWQKVPEGYNSVDFAKKLLRKDIAVVTTPGNWLSRTTSGTEGGTAVDAPAGAGSADGKRAATGGGVSNPRNPGEGYVRLALVPSIEKVEEASRRIKSLRL
jgi:LL-diaminopimelate aminotransferase